MLTLDEVRDSWSASLDALVAAVDAPTERDLLAPSRCHGWAVVDLVAHLVAGLEEMLHGVTAPTDDPPDCDAASYWDDFPSPDPDDPGTIAAIVAGRRRGSVPDSPEGVRRQFRVVAEAVRRATDPLDDRARVFQGHVMTAGDFLAIWVVEVVVHHLDLASDGRLQPPPADALGLTRRVIERRAGGLLPTDDDVLAVLVGAGRVPVPAAWTGLAGLSLPVLG